MEVKMQTSFIPKKPVVESGGGNPGMSLFLLLAIIVFIVAIVMSLGVWLWQSALVSQKGKDIAALAEAKKTYEEKTIDDLIRLDDRIEESKNLLNNHLAVSPVFALLEKNVLKNVRLKSMKFSDGGAGKIRLDLSGTALTYDVLSKQSDAFGRADLRDLISEPVISDFNPTADGSIAFNFTALVDPKLVSYRDTALTAVRAPVVTGTTTGTTSATSSTQ